MRTINDLTKTWYIRKIWLGRTAEGSSFPTPDGTEGHTASESSGLSSGPLPTAQIPELSRSEPILAGINYMGDINMALDMDMGPQLDGGMFSFMKRPRFRHGAILRHGYLGRRELC